MPTKSEVQERKFSAHTMRFEPPDLFLLKLVGDFSLQDMLDLAECYKRASGKFFVIVDVSALGSVGNDAKKALKELPLAAGVAIFGASLQVQVFASLLTKVQLMVNMGKGIDVKFVSNEDEGRKHVDHLRQVDKKSRG
jgi:hypothetical protein